MAILADRESRLLIDGKLVTGSAGTFPTANPATEETLGVAADASAEDMGAAIAAARRAFDDTDWSTNTELRVRCLRQLQQAMRDHIEDLRELTIAEVGAPRMLTSAAQLEGPVEDLSFCADTAESYQWTSDLGIASPMGIKPRRTIAREAVGVVGAITPWNFPSAMITRKCAPALAVGCPVVVKPSELTPYSALALAELAERAGVPPGVFNVVVGSRAAEIGGELCANADVRKLGFTGSTAVGKLLMAQAAQTVTRVSLELGGHAPLLVFDDADVDVAVAGALASKFRNAGQTCVCANRILVQEGIYDAFSTKLADAVAAMRVGAGTEAGVAIGPLIDGRAVDKSEAHVTDALDKGATLLAGGKRLPEVGANFFAPTVLGDATVDMKIFREETFGPVAPLFKFKDEAEAVAMANDTPYGLAAYFFTRDLGRAWRVSEGLDYGLVGCNEGIMATEVAPFGGMKESGLGREGSKYGVDEFIEAKYVLMGGIGAP